MFRKNKLLFIFLSFFTINLAVAYDLPDFKTLTKQIRPSVVSLTVERNAASNNRRGNGLLEDLLRRRSPQQNDEFQAPAIAQGSGFIISEDGYILTNRHVLDQADKVKVFMSDRREFEAEIIGSDSGTDVALIKIDAKNLPVVKTGNSSALEPGEWVMGIGAPFGFEHTVTAGIVSAKRRTLPGEQYVPFIQTDVAINPGNSGGPLIDMKGKVIGINSQIFSRNGGFMGISFSIPIELAMGVAKQLKKDGKVSRGYLGVSYQDVDYKMAKSFGLKQVYGAILTQVSPKSPAEKGGLKEQDVVLKINGERVERASDLPFIIGQTHPNEEVKLLIWREGKNKTVDLKVGERPSSQVASIDEEPSRLSNKLGLKLQNLTEEQQESIGDNGVLVAVLENGPAAEAGVRQGDIIISVAREPTTTVVKFKKVVDSLKPGEEVPLLVLRPRLGRRFFLITIPSDE